MNKKILKFIAISIYSALVITPPTIVIIKTIIINPILAVVFGSIYGLIIYTALRLILYKINNR